MTLNNKLSWAKKYLLRFEQINFLNTYPWYTVIQRKQLLPLFLQSSPTRKILHEMNNTFAGITIIMSFRCQEGFCFRSFSVFLFQAAAVLSHQPVSVQLKQWDSHLTPEYFGSQRGSWSPTQHTRIPGCWTGPNHQPSTAGLWGADMLRFTAKLWSGLSKAHCSRCVGSGEKLSHND